QDLSDPIDLPLASNHVEGAVDVPVLGCRLVGRLLGFPVVVSVLRAVPRLNWHADVLGLHRYTGGRKTRNQSSALRASGLSRPEAEAGEARTGPEGPAEHSALGQSLRLCKRTFLFLRFALIRRRHPLNAR